MVNLPRSELILAIAAFVAVAFGTIALFLSWEGILDWQRRRGRRARIEAGERRLGDLTTLQGQSILKPRGDEGASRLDQLLVRLPRGKDLKLTLEGARIGWTPGMFVLLTLGMGVAASVLSWVLGGWPFGVLGFFVGAGLPRLWVGRRKSRRLRQFEEQFPEAVDLLARATRAGHPFSSGIAMVGKEGPKIVAEEFHQVAEENRFGMPLEDSLWGLVDRVELMDVRIFTTAVLIQREVGGNLAEILDNLGETIRARFAVKRQLRVHTAQGRMSGYVLAALPIFMAGALYFLDREYISILWEHWLGKILIAVAIVMQILGYLWIRHIVDIEI